MSMRVGDLYANLSLRAQEFRAGLQGAMQAAAEAGSQMSSSLGTQPQAAIGKTGDAMERLTWTTRGYIKDMSKVVTGILIAQGFYRLINVIRQASTELFQFSQDMEAAAVSFGLMLRSKSEAKVFLGLLEDFAAVTPFQMKDAQVAAQRLMAMGFAAETVIPTLRAITDAASLMGAEEDVLNRITKAFGEIHTRGVVAARELIQLAQAGIPAFEILQQELKLTAHQMEHIGAELKIPADVGIAALLKGIEKRYGGASALIAETTKGVISTIRDNLLLIGRSLFTGMYTAISVRLKELRDWLNWARSLMRRGGVGALFESIVSPKVQATVRLAIVAVGSLVGSFKLLRNALALVLSPASELFLRTLRVALPILAGVARSVAVLAEWLARATPLARWFGYALGALWVAAATRVAVLGLVGAIKLLYVASGAAAGIRMLTGAVQALYIAMAKNPITALILVVASALLSLALQSRAVQGWIRRLTGSLLDLYGLNTQGALEPVFASGYEDDIARYNKWLGDTSAGLAAMADSAEKANKRMVASFDEVYQIPEELDSAGLNLEDLQDAFKLPEVLPDLAKFFKGVGDVALPPMKSFAQWLREALDLRPLSEVYRDIKQWVLDTAGLIGDWVTDTVDRVHNWVDRTWGSFANWCVDVYTKVKTWASDTWDTFKSWSSNTWTTFKNWTSRTWQKFTQWASDTWDTFKNWSSNTWTTFKNWSSDTYNTITDWIARTWSSFADWTSRTWQKFTQWASDTWDTFKNWSSNTWTTFKNWSSDTLTTFKNWCASVGGSIANWASGTWTTIETWVTNTRANLGGWVSDTRASLSSWVTSTRAALQGWTSDVRDTLQSWVTSTRASLQAWVTSTRASFEGWVTGTWGTFSTWAANTWGAFSTWAANTLGTLTGWASNTWGAFTMWAANTWTAIKTWCFNTQYSFSTWFGTAAFNFTTWFTNNIASFSSWALTTWTTVKTWDTNLSATLTNWAATAWQTIKTWCANAIASFKQWVVDIGSVFRGIVPSFSSAIAPMIDALRSLGNRLISLAQGIAARIKAILQSASQGGAGGGTTAGGVGAGGGSAATTTTTASVATSASSGTAGTTGTAAPSPTGTKPDPGTTGVPGTVAPSTTVAKVATTAAKVTTTTTTTLKTEVPTTGSGRFGGATLAAGGVITRPQIAAIGEGNRREAVLPLSREALRPFAQVIAAELAGVIATLPGRGSQEGSPPVYVGTLIADERSLKELERRLHFIRVKEDQRRGA